MLYLKKEKENGKKYKRFEIKEIVRKKGIELINKGFIDKKEFNKFTISFSWIKQLLKEYNIKLYINSFNKYKCNNLNIILF